jgi:hypothetical protein
MERKNLYLSIQQKLQEIDEFLGLGVYEQIVDLAIPSAKKALQDTGWSTMEEFERTVFKEYIRAHNTYKTVMSA